MTLSRRTMFKTAGSLFGASLASAYASGVCATQRKKKPYKLTDTKEFTNICCYCSGGCGSICSVRNGELINLEGDPDHPVNLGGLCAKGAGMFGLRNVYDKNRRAIPNPARLSQPMVRRPFSDHWEKISWNEAIDEIAKLTKKTRDQSFVEKEDGITVNRTEGIAVLGAAQLNCEEAWLVQKYARSLGIVAVDNQTRVCHSSTVRGLAPSFGRGSMTGHWSDFQNADVVLSIGSNNVENHPLSSRWVHRAVNKGGTWIVVDPRYTRSAAQADMYAQLRPGTDIAFYGGLINYILNNEKWQKEYVLNYTNATFLLRPDYNFDEATGLFSGWDSKTQTYDHSTWGYQVEEEKAWDTSEKGNYSWVKEKGVPTFTPPKLKVPKKDKSLQNPLCVLNVMKAHYARYTPDMVSETTGMDKDVMMAVYEKYASTGARDKVGTILYALGQTQHTYGSQNCRAMCIVQLLLGNVGLAGGGINALRGEPNVQGSTDMAVAVDDMPGYLSWPAAKKHTSLRSYIERETYADGYYTNKPKFLVSLLKEWYGDFAQKDNDYAFDYLPKIGYKRDYTTISTFTDMGNNTIKGYYCFGMNPCHSAANAKNVRKSMTNLEWLVVADWFETETASFWKAPDMDAKTIGTTVFMLPAALIYEKEGTIANSGRWLQWRYKAVEPVGQAKNDGEILSLLMKKMKSLYEQEGGVCPDQVTKVRWNYDENGQYSAVRAAHAVNGYDVKTGRLLTSFTQLKADGSTACGNWIYSGYFSNNDAPMSPGMQPCTRRSKVDKGGLGLYSEWSFAWPANRRILYNRASSDMKGQPWNKERELVRWDGQKWIETDVADFASKKVFSDGRVEAIAPNNKAFMMAWEQQSRLFSTIPNDGPMPEHYEPFETPVANRLNGAGSSPCAMFTKHPSVKKGDAKTYPIVATSYSVVEHWQTGMQTRNVPMILETSPAPFIEISEELAKEKGIKNRDYVRVFNNRGSVRVQAMVTIRIKPMTIHNRLVHMVGLPHHFSWSSMFGQGDTMNDLTPNVGDPNSFIPEYKAFLVDIERAN